MADHPNDWKTPEDAAAAVDRSLSTLYRWLAKPLEDTNIRRRMFGPRDPILVHVPTLREFEATQKRGRPRKSA